MDALARIAKRVIAPLERSNGSNELLQELVMNTFLDEHACLGRTKLAAVIASTRL